MATKLPSAAIVHFARNYIKPAFLRFDIWRGPFSQGMIRVFNLRIYRERSL